ncbi:hypothetical protein [Ancylobacter lacus]|uniref:hypothetical protein n=1 Tax=Ancylobacter lacus TaxID=2579970 RepID=UPI001BCEE08F|nr:hypothetical protein [Ancylobacter lacus]MBS7539473.1 hypothetical protein [Ancylobacter lacus]
MRRLLARLAVVASVSLSGAAALAAPTGAALFFETPFLAALPAGTTLSYSYRHTTSDPSLGESFDEKMEMKIEAAPEDAAKRVADVDIFRGSQHREAGPFPVALGNPLALVLLEREAKEIAQLTKGSPFYIRNRMKEALMNGTAEDIRISYAGKDVPAWKLDIAPFATDPHKEQLLEIANRRYSFVFSEAVPGGLYEVKVVTPKADKSGAMIETVVTLSGSTTAAPAP